MAKGFARKCVALQRFTAIRRISGRAFATADARLWKIKGRCGRQISGNNRRGRGGKPGRMGTLLGL